VSIERITNLEAGQVAALVAESEAQGLRFVRRLADEWASGANRFDRPGEALFVARDDGRVLGVGGLNLDPYAAEATVGRVRHLYVLRAYRRLGFGRRIASSESRQPPGSFVADKTRECFSYESCLLRDSGVILRLSHQFVIERNGCTHMHIIASFRC